MKSRPASAEATRGQRTLPDATSRESPNNADASVIEDHRQAFEAWTGGETCRFRLTSWCCNEVQDPPLAVSLAVYCSPRGYHSALKLSA